MSYGSLWYGKNTNFPGFLYKKNVGSGVGITRYRRQITNAQTDIENRYVPGAGVGATSVALRRLKKRMATTCCNKV